MIESDDTRIRPETEQLMSDDRLDPRAIERISGPAWERLREVFTRLNELLLSLSPTVRGELTTIYVKYFGPETGSRPFAVLWMKRASELTLGLSLPEASDVSALTDAPSGCKYAGLTRYLTISAEHPEIPPDLPAWVLQAYEAMRQ